MKKLSILFMLALAVASCTKEGSDSENGGLFSSETGYIKLAINLPVENNAGSKGENDKFDDGTPNEYAVTDATLILFEGNSEATATLSTAYDLNLSFNKETTTDNITSTAQIVQKINDPLASGNNFYALVILNRNGLLTVSPSSNILSVQGTDCTGKTLSEFIADTKITLSSKVHIVTGAGTSATQFFMSNAPLFTAPGGGTDPAAGGTGAVKILSEIDRTKIYESESLAASNPATEVYVERAASKVTFRLSSSLPSTTETNSLAFDVLGWQLNNTNEKTYLVRDVASFDTWKSLYSNAPSLANKYRFVGHTQVAAGLYRTYWCTDPNYTPTDGDGVTYWDEKTTPAVDWLGVSDVAYCAENTFDVEHQKDVNTTTVIVKAEFNGGSTFYTINNNSGTLYDEAGLIAAVKSYFLSNDAITAALTTLINSTVDASKLTVVLSTPSTTAGIVRVGSITVDKSVVTSGADIQASDLTLAGGVKALDLVNANNEIRRYVDGISYYPVHIKHFGNDLTPWRGGETVAPSAGNIYPGASAANYLGRYGMVRNNWYDIEVTKIRNLGTATVPTLGNTPLSPEDDPDGPGNGNYDDDIDQYISVRINILAWAKRTQTVDL